jgi:DNA-binding MarR family transcriptional regulator
MKREDQIQSVIESIGRLQRLAIPPDWHKVGLSRAQVGMLYMLHYHHGASMKKIADYLDVTKSAVTQLVEPLIEKGLVIRQADPKDRRVAVLSLSTKGHKAVRDINQKKMLGIRSALDSLSDKDLGTMATLHAKMDQRTDREEKK